MKKMNVLFFTCAAMAIMAQCVWAKKPAPVSTTSRDGDTEMTGGNGKTPVVSSKEPLLGTGNGGGVMVIAVDNKETEAFNNQGRAYFAAIRTGDDKAVGEIMDDKKQPWTDDCYYYDHCTLRTSNKEPNSPLWVAIDLAVTRQGKEAEAAYQKRLKVITKVLAKGCANRNVLFYLGHDNWCGVPACLCCCGCFGKCLYVWGGPVHKAAHENKPDLLTCLCDENKYPIDEYTTCKTSRELTPVQMALRANATQAIEWFLKKKVTLSSGDRCCIGKAKTQLLRHNNYTVMCGSWC